MLSIVGQHVLVELGMPDLGLCAATPVMPEEEEEPGGGEACEKSSLMSSKAPTRSTHTFVRDNSRSYLTLQPSS
jgi:hypothetical protein